jgi:hypothetical protein
MTHCTEELLQTVEVTGLDEYPYPRINLSSSDDVRRELARVYRDARHSRIAVSDGTKLAFILSQILKAIEVYSLENRIQALEHHQIRKSK